jgi:cytochrome c2/mono/diheme cytochrome c family protein
VLVGSDASVFVLSKEDRMPIPTDTLRRMSGLNRWFALSSVAMLLSLLWFTWKDYDRPWRGIQDDYMRAQAALAHLDLLDTQTEAYQEKIRSAEEAVDAARAESAKRSAERGELVEKLGDADARHYSLKLKFGDADSIVQVTRSQYEVALSEHGADAPKTKAIKAVLDREEADVAELGRQKESVEDEQHELKRRLKEIDAPVTEAERKLATLRKVADDAAVKEDQYSNVLVKTVINLPLADFTAPRGTPARQEVRQLVLPEVRQELNYLQTYTTDRCTTCHVSINDPKFSMDDLARNFERSIPAINEAMRREGHGELTVPAVPELAGEDVPELAPGAVTDHWAFLTADQQREYFDGLLGLVNSYLTQTGRKEIELSDVLFAHPNLDLFVDVDSPHPMTQFGCTVCHEGNPQETDFVQAAHTPVDHHQEHEWAEKYYVTAALVPNVTFGTIEHYWDRPMHLPKFSEAGCSKCHTKVFDIAEFNGESQATTLNLGRDLFARVGCVNCHNVEDIGPHRKVGPDLSRIASKLEPGFAEHWIHDPKKFRPSTWMPHFFGQENNGPGSENERDRDPVLRTESEVAAVRYYLFTISKSWAPEPIPSGLTGDSARGRKLFSEVGCLGCHANISEHGEEMVVSDMVTEAGRTEKVAAALYEEMNYVERTNYLIEHLPSDRDSVFQPEAIGDRPIFSRYAPELSSIGSKVSREWLFGWLKDPSDYYPGTRMPSLRLTDQEAIDVAEYLLTLKDNDGFDRSPFPQDDAHQEMADELVYTLLSSQNSARQTRSIMNDENESLSRMLVKMLTAYMGEEDARSKIASLDGRGKRMMYLGNKMVAHYGCYSCHNIGGFENSPPPGTDLSIWSEKPISQLDFAFFDSAHKYLTEAKPEVFGHVYRPENEELIYWSRGENPEERVTHTHGAFAWHKMLNPRIWDREKIKGPYEKLKMPNFYFTEDQADSLVTYLLSRRRPRVSESLQVEYEASLKGAIAEGRNLTRSLNCVGCHQIEENRANVHQYLKKNVGGEEVFDEVNAPPWLRGQGAKVNYPWMYTFFNQVEMLRPWLKIRMPSFKLSEEETETLVKYFAGISQHESAALSEHITAVEKYIESAQKKADTEGDDAPDPGLWFTEDSLLDTAKFLASHSVKNRLVLGIDVDPAFNTVEEMESGYADVLRQVRFVRDLFDVRFPFAEQARPLVDESRFRLGEALFYDLKCLACHVLGDPEVEGSNPAPSAPNLSLAYHRLRQEWVHEWLQEPSSIQPGTKMPQLFGGGNSVFASYPDEDRAELEAKYGATGEAQMQLLIDFIYNAGQKKYDALQPGGVVSESGSADGDDEGEEDEEDGEEEEEDEEDEEEDD